MFVESPSRLSCLCFLARERRAPWRSKNVSECVLLVEGPDMGNCGEDGGWNYARTCNKIKVCFFASSQVWTERRRSSGQSDYRNKSALDIQDSIDYLRTVVERKKLVLS